MSHKFRYGDKVIANGQEAIVQVVGGGIIRLDIDGGVRMWHPEDLELVHSDMRKLNVGDEVVVQEPTKLQKKYYPGGWNESHCGREDSMRQCVGKKFIIESIMNDEIRFIGNRWYWNECNLQKTQDIETFCLY